MLRSFYNTAAVPEAVCRVDVFNPEVFEKKLGRLGPGYLRCLGDLFEYGSEKEVSRFNECRLKLGKYAVNGASFMQSAQESNKNIMVEGANALMLDVNYSSYPLITSSNTTLGSIISGITLNSKNITGTIGVVKACTARLQEIDREWGTPTGRSRRCGWLDLVVVKFSTSIKYCNFLNLTKLDVLDTVETIKVAIAYKVDCVELEH
ncbi:Adenylosuccinate synthetase [Fusarium oxysporum f. sp. rapae]|uniref:Adenylosuccinate synthetase n=1 Tax=Fusarium oxysporum f. sp. rapae TaxID=485398 RepID=A0A8J5P3D6_FUSOX|nr:Adenylosuccinate synthetase [Fusarium oxysporum f. sp. rapae]